MKYYYEGQLIRTSKTHHYTHACVAKKDEKWVTLGCSGTKAGAEKVKNEKINSYLNSIDGYERQIKAIDEGKSGYHSKKNGFVRLSETYYKTDRDARVKAIEEIRQTIKRIQESWLIVELSEEA
jgi:hypothetical protein